MEYLFTQVRTLFVSGLPMDVRPREIYLLFRTYDGYAGSSLKLMAKHGKIPQVCGRVDKIQNTAVVQRPCRA